MKKKKLKKRNKRLLQSIERLEAENRNLKSEVTELVFYPRSLRSFAIKNRVKIDHCIENAINTAIRLDT